MKLKPLLFTILFFLICLFVSVIVTDYPLSFSSLSKKNISAIVLRDNVSPLQKRGTAWLTFHYFEQYYAEFDYIETSHRHFYKPDQKEFIYNLNRLLKSSDSVDVFFLAHGNFYYEMLNEVDSVLRKKIRMAYNSGCGNNDQCLYYQKQKVNYYVAHSGDNSISPVFYIFFIRRLFSEPGLAQAVKKSNEPAEKVLSLFISDEWVKGSLGNFHDLKNEKITIPLIDSVSTDDGDL
ncbi:MAG: hypothetical protein IAF38_08285 [Bacteroidia bacterium]|nr:hypothetical protein [Bacteroidia bacterium]